MTLCKQPFSFTCVKSPSVFCVVFFQDTDGCDITAENWPMSMSCQSSLEEKCEQTSDSLTGFEQVMSCMSPSLILMF